jgi:hypothetical protein
MTVSYLDLQVMEEARLSSSLPATKSMQSSSSHATRRSSKHQTSNLVEVHLGHMCPSSPSRDTMDLQYLLYIGCVLCEILI